MVRGGRGRRERGGGRKVEKGEKGGGRGERKERGDSKYKQV